MSISPHRLICRMHREITLLASSSVISPAQRDTIILSLRSNERNSSRTKRHYHPFPSFATTTFQASTESKPRRNKTKLRAVLRNKDSTMQEPQCFCFSALKRGIDTGGGAGFLVRGQRCSATVDEWVQT